MKVKITVVIGLTLLAFLFYSKLNTPQTKPTPPKRQYYELIIYGDSHGEAWKKLPLEDSLNTGKSGWNCSKLIEELQGKHKGLRSKYALIFIGGNDVMDITKKEDFSEKAIDEIFQNIQKVMDTVQAEQVFITTVPPLFTIPISFNWQLYLKSQAPRLRLNEKIRNISGGKKRILDLAKIFESRDDLSELTTDGVHLNEKAYALVWEEFLKQTKKVRHD